MKDIINQLRDEKYIEEQIIKIKKCIATDEREIKYYTELIKENKRDIQRLQNIIRILKI